MMNFGLNLLPPDEKENLRRRRAAHFVFSYCLVLTVLFVVFIIILWLLTLALRWNLSVTEKRLESERELARVQQVENLEQKIAFANEIFSSAVSIEKERTAVVSRIADLLSTIPSGVTLKTLGFDAAKGIFNLEGEAVAREDFIDFENIIKQSNLYENLDSPISNILKQTNLSFRISFSLKKN